MKRYLLTLSLCIGVFVSAEKSTNAACKPQFTVTTGANGSISCNLTFPSAGAISSILWHFGDGGWSNAMNPMHTYTYNFTYTIGVTVMDTSGCQDSTNMSVAISNGTVPACPGNSHFNYQPVGTTTEFSNVNNITWRIVDFGDGTSGPIVGPGGTVTHQYALNGTYLAKSVAYIMQGPGGVAIPCDSVLTNVVVNNVICQAIIFTNVDTFVNGFHAESFSTGALNYSWYLNGTFVSNQPFINYFGAPMNPGTYDLCLAITGPSSCYDSVCTSFVFTANYIPCPGVSYAMSKAPGCDNYQFSTVNSTNLSSVAWTVDNVQVSTSFNPLLHLGFPAGSNIPYHTVEVRGTGTNCTSSGLFGITNPASFYVYPDTAGGVNTWYVFPNSGLAGTHLWDFGDGVTSNLNTPTHLYSAPGFYDLCYYYMDPNGCSYDYCQYSWYFKGAAMNAPVQIIVLPAQATNEIEAFENIHIYPNPASDRLFIRLGNEAEKISRVQISDAKGSIVLDLENTVSGVVDISTCAAGMYWITVFADEHLIGKTRFFKE